MDVLKAMMMLVCTTAGTQAQMTPLKSRVLGCSVLESCGEIFDDYSDGYHGAITEICWSKHSKGDTSATTLTEIITNYAGHNVPHGGNYSSIWYGQACFALEPAETIVQVDAEVWVDKYEPDYSELYSVRFVTDKNRTSDWFGSAAEYGVRYDIQSIKAPVTNAHVIAIHGFGLDKNWTYPIYGLGVYWGFGGGAGAWVPITSCVGCGRSSYEFDFGTDKSHSSESKVTRTWSHSVTWEMGYSFEGFHTGITISNTWAGQVMHDSKESFEVTTMEKRKFTCDKDNLYQWQMTSNFDDPDTPVTTYTASMVCTDSFTPCCLPGTFSTDPTVCDLAPNAPNQCNTTWTLV